MSDVRGTISVDVAFTDSTTVSGAQSLKTITLRDATEYTSGKVAVVKGTCGTTLSSIDPANLAYINAAGNSVSFSNVEAMAFSVSGSRSFAAMQGNADLQSTDNRVAISPMLGDTGEIFIRVMGTTGTASYTIVLYGT